MMTSAEKENINKVLNDSNAIRKFDYLYWRWQDEKQYEDFNDYVEAMMKFMPSGATLVKGSKRPFGVTIKYGGQKVQISLKHRGNYCSLAAKIYP